jgi:hypothetical protein
MHLPTSLKSCRARPSPAIRSSLCRSTPQPRTTCRGFVCSAFRRDRSKKNSKRCSNKANEETQQNCDRRARKKWCRPTSDATGRCPSWVKLRSPDVQPGSRLCLQERTSSIWPVRSEKCQQRTCVERATQRLPTRSTGRPGIHWNSRPYSFSPFLWFQDYAASHSTLLAPGICRNARVSAQLNATVSTNPMGAFTVAGTLKSNSQYCSHSAIG